MAPCEKALIDRLITVLLLSGLSGVGFARHLSAQTPETSIIAPKDSPSYPNLGSIPRGRSTVFGAEILTVDPVRDQLTVRIYGERPTKILFDERTEVYRDGQQVSLQALRPRERVSIETTVDGTKVFARSIHMLADPAVAKCEGRVQRFDAETGKLSVSSGLSGSVQVLVEGSTAFARQGQESMTGATSGSADLKAGTLVDVEFAAAGKDTPVARRITILAIPGSPFVFTGRLRALDVHAGMLVLIDPRDEKSYEVNFAPDLPAAQNLRIGDNVRVVANYDGTRYVANQLAEN